MRVKVRKLGERARRTFPQYTRGQRREMTLRKAKEIAKKRGLDRNTMFMLRDSLMRDFPKGTIDDSD